jgi:hypothetical protein
MNSITQREKSLILMMTGLDDVESIHRAFEVGATDVVAKPGHWSLGTLLLIGHWVVIGDVVALWVGIGDVVALWL